MLNKKVINILLVMMIFSGLLAEISLLEQKEYLISVSVVGSVRVPGIYRLKPGSRLSEVFKIVTRTGNLEAATEDKNPKRTEELVEREHSLRNIVLIRDEVEKSIDLQQYFLKGDMEENPILCDSDIVCISACELNLHIYGSVFNPGSYEYLSGDRITDLLAFSQGVTESANLEKAELVRLDFISGETERIEFSPSRILDDATHIENIELQPGDRIYIRQKANYNSDFRVVIDGEVKYPGEYAIEEGKTTLLDILKLSGGVRDEGCLSKAYLQRISTRDTTISSDPEFLRLSSMNSGEMNVVEYEYLKFKMREMEGKIILDFSDLWEEGSKKADILLENNDYIFIPRRLTKISVSGAVMNPGLYEYLPGKDFEYYIELAGGCTNNADERRIKIIQKESGSWLNKNLDVLLEAGDTVFVPEKEEIDYWQRTKDVFSIVAQLATIIIAVQSIYSN